MNHLTEEQLALHFYGDLGQQAHEVEEHIELCAECRAEFERLAQVLRSVEMVVPERSADYEAQLWHNLKAQLPEPQQKAPWWTFASWRNWQSFAAAGSVAALLMLAFWLGTMTRKPEPQVATAPQQAPAVIAQAPQQEKNSEPQQAKATGTKSATNGAKPVAQTPAAKSGARDRILLVALGDHLERSQMVLVELMNAEQDGTVDISSERQLARDLVSENRLYRQTAVQAKDRAMANLLDELERVLVDIAHEPAKLSGPELASIKQRLESQGIVFKVRVVGSQVKERKQQFEKNAGRENVKRG